MNKLIINFNFNKNLFPFML